MHIFQLLSTPPAMLTGGGEGKPFRLARQELPRGCNK
jgi:hypothetical protein